MRLCIACRERAPRTGRRKCRKCEKVTSTGAVRASPWDTSNELYSVKTMGTSSIWLSKPLR